MKKLLGALLLGSILVPLGLLRAQEGADVQLKFIDALRKKGLADLALQHIEKLQKNPPPGLAAILPLEAARTRVALAQIKAPEDRKKLLVEAQKGLEDYLKGKEQTAEGPSLKLEIARVAAYQGQALLSQALRADKAEDRIKFAKDAREQFIQARTKLYDAALKDMGDLLGKYKNPDAKAEAEFKGKLAADLLEGKLDRAKTFMFEGRSYVDTDNGDERKKQAEAYEEALKALKVIIFEKPGINDEARWLAGAWYIDVARRADKGSDAEDTYKKLMAAYDDVKKNNYDPPLAKKVQEEKLATMLPAIRLASYVYIQAIRDNKFKVPTGKPKAKFLEESCVHWLNEFKAYQRTPEGWGVRFELAYALFDQALAQSKKYNDPKAKPLYDKAEVQFSQVAASHSDLSEEANRQSIVIKIARIGEATSVEALKDFEECYLKARFEMTQLQKAGKALKKVLDDPPPEKVKADKAIADLKKQQKSHLKNVIAAFNRALELATPLTPPNKVDEVRYFLAYTYLIAGDPFRAAVMADYLAHKDPPGKHGPLAANYALLAYEQILKKHNEPINQDRLKDLAEFIVGKRADQWKDQPITASAHYALALIYMRQKDYVKTIEQLETLPKDFRAYTFAQCQLALIALNVSGEAAGQQDAAKAEKYRFMALQALRKIPILPPNADQATAAMFFTAQLNQGTILYNNSIQLLKDGNEKAAEATLKEMVTFTKGLGKQFKDYPGQLDKDVSAKLESALGKLDKFARFGEARLAYKAGDYDKVLGKDFTGDIVNQLEGLAKAEGVLALPDYQVTGDLLGLALRAQVQKGNFKEAEKVLDLVQKLRDPNALDVKTNPAASAILQNLLADLSNQIQTLKKDGKTDKLKETVKNFTTFFDTLVKNKGAKSLEYNDLVFLANSYASVDQHAKAAELYGSLPAPTLTLPPNATKEAQAQAEAEHKKAEQLWWFLQVRCGEEWRRANDLQKAKDVLQKILDNPKAAAKIQAQKELILVFEDDGKFSEAIKRWNEFLKNPSLQSQMYAKGSSEATKRKAKEYYYDGFYHYIYSWYMFSQNEGKAKEEKHLTQAANYIWRLELDHQKAVAEAKKNKLDPPTDTGWAIIGPRLVELMNSSGGEKLKKEYERQKSAASGK